MYDVIYMMMSIFGLYLLFQMASSANEVNERHRIGVEAAAMNLLNQRLGLDHIFDNIHNQLIMINQNTQNLGG